MKFLIREPQKDQNFSLIYEDYSFCVEPFDGNGGSSILVNDLELAIDEEGKILYVCGYCPLIIYEETDVWPQNYSSHTLILLLKEPPVPGISYRLNKQEDWPIYINKKKGWVCLGNPKLEGKQAIEFAPNCVAVLENQELIAVWLRPESLPEFKEK